MQFLLLYRYVILLFHYVCISMICYSDTHNTFRWLILTNAFSIDIFHKFNYWDVDKISTENIDSRMLKDCNYFYNLLYTAYWFLLTISYGNLLCHLFFKENDMKSDYLLCQYLLFDLIKIIEFLENIFVNIDLYI